MQCEVEAGWPHEDASQQWGICNALQCKLPIVVERLRVPSSLYLTLIELNHYQAANANSQSRREPGISPKFEVSCAIGHNGHIFHRLNMGSGRHWLQWS